MFDRAISEREAATLAHAGEPSARPRVLADDEYKGYTYTFGRGEAFAGGAPIARALGVAAGSRFPLAAQLPAVNAGRSVASRVPLGML